jgi:hypothetical protein
MQIKPSTRAGLDSRRHAGWSIGTLLLAGALAGLAGCGADSSGPDPNRLPETELVAAPPDSSRVPNHVTFEWNGRDADGTVRDFDYILDTYARTVATIDQVAPQVPSASDPRWTRVSAYRLELVVIADTLRADPHGDIGTGEFDRWHTFYLRAVDVDGGADPTPEMRTFQAFTLAPDMMLQAPLLRGATATLPRNLVVNWAGSDPVGSPGDYQDPVETRWALQEVVLDGTGAPIGYPEALYDLPASAWSPWKAYTAADSTGREAALRDLVANGPARRSYVFALQGRDDGGAITPKFNATVLGKNNYGVLIADGMLPVGPTFTVRASSEPLSSWSIEGVGPTTIVASVGSDTLNLYWTRPSAEQYGARVNGTRYGWNITDQTDDNEWTAWANTLVAGVHVLAPGGDTFYIQARDQLDQISTGIITFHRAASRARR